MTNIEMTRLCAEMLWYEEAGVDRFQNGDEILYVKDSNHTMHVFNPLHDDAQAMALVKRFGLWIERTCEANIGDTPTWCVTGDRVSGHTERHCNRTDLNRAIVECVAKMQERK